MSWQDSIHDFLSAQRLNLDYAKTAEHWFLPLADRIAQQCWAAGRPLLVGINGSQGSGKSTLAAYLRLALAERFNLAAIDLSLDDFYRTRAERRRLAEQVHPLLLTRGVPGTHDMTLLQQTLQRLLGAPGHVPVSRFDKAIDDRAPMQQWPVVQAPLSLVILEGWCLGTPSQSAQALQEPINTLEREEDPTGVWRHYVNGSIEREYQWLCEQVDVWVMLQAPSFHSVYRWRLEQEEKLMARAGGKPGQDSRVMSAADIARFIQFFQRLTEQALSTLPKRVHYLYRLDQERGIIDLVQPTPLKLR